MKAKFLVAVIVVLALGAGYYLGTYRGHTTGKEEAERNAPKINVNDYVLSSDYEALITDYNKLIDDYNELSKKASQASQVIHPPRQPLSCSSYSYGIDDRFTSTNCY